MTDIKKSFLGIKVGVHNNRLCLKCTCMDTVFWREKNMAGLTQNESTDQMIIFWMLKEIKPLFFSMPADTIHVEIEEDCKARFGKIVEFCGNCLRITNGIIVKYAGLKNVAEKHDKLLFYNIDGNVNLKNFYEQLDQKNSDNHLYMNFKSGFNGKTRQWEKTDPPFTVDEFLNLVQTEKIKKIISLNHYLLEKYFGQGIYILAVFKYIGVEYVIFDHDPWDQTPFGYLTKSFYNCESFDRFSYSYFHKHWDKYYGLKNVNHVAFINKYPKQFSLDQLPDDYNIVIMTNARMPEVISFLNPMLFLLSHFKSDSFFEEVELWYYSLRYMILNIMDFNEFERLHYNSLLLKFVYSISQFIKYDVIGSIKTDRKVQLYGDNAWTHIFPEIYNTYLDRRGIDKLFSKKTSLYLLMNWQTTWLESSGVTYESMSYQIPFLNHPALAKTSELQALSKIEYRNPTDLNKKINNMNEYLDDELITSIKFLNRISNGGMATIDNRLNNNDPYPSDDPFSVLLSKHDELIKKKVHEYIDKNEAFIRNSFHNLFIKSVQYNLEESKYFSKPYMQRLLHYAKKMQK